MKKVLFLFLLIGSALSMQAQPDSTNIDSFCFVEINIEATAAGTVLSAWAFDFADPAGATFSYSWSSGETTQSIPFTAPGTYCVTATADISGCTAASCITVTDDGCDVGTWYDWWSQEIHAYGSGIPPFSYQWDNGDTTSSIPAAVGDLYCVTVTDALGCAADTCGVVQGGGLDSFCFADIFVYADSNGNYVLEALGGDIILPPWGSDFSYVWSTGDTTMSIVVSDLAEYCVTVTNGTCTAEACIDLENTDCDVSIGCDPPGTFTAFATGVYPYSYLWSTGDDSPSIPVVEGDTYCVTITDAVGCVAEACMTADSFPPIDTFCEAYIDYFISDSGLILTAYQFPFWDPVNTYAWSTGETTESIVGNAGETYCVTITSANTGCVSSSCINIDEPDCTDLVVICDPGGGLGVYSSGLPPFTYLWSNGETTDFIIGIVDSTYCVTITDALDCMADTCVTAMGFPIDTFCEVYINYELTGSGIVLTVDNFPFWNPFVSFLWSTGDTTASIIGEPGENYCVTATTIDGCEASACIDLGDFDCSDLYVICDPGELLSIFSGGIPPFTYEWSTGDTTPYIMAEADSTYCVTITDALDCVADTCVTVMAFPPDTFNFPSSIFGYVFEADSSVLGDYEGTVYLYKKDSDGDFQLVDSTAVEGDLLFNSYFFHDVDDGEYLTKAVVTSLITGDDYIPTYHFSAMEWNEADVILVEDDGIGGPLIAYPILLLGTTSLDGPGSINGAIVDINDIIDIDSRSGQGVHGVTIILTNEHDETLDYVMTSSTGNFNFGNLPYGTYHVYADYINLSGPYAVVTIGPDNENAEVSFEVDGDDVFLDNKDVDLSGELEIFPNPTSDRLFVHATDHINIESVKLMSLQGKTLIELTNVSNKALEINTAMLNHGIHVIQLVTDRGILNQKVMIID